MYLMERVDLQSIGRDWEIENLVTALTVYNAMRIVDFPILNYEHALRDGI